MTLRIKDQSHEEDIIELVRAHGVVHIKINGEIMSNYFDDGDFKFFGNKGVIQFMGRWKE